VSLAMSLFGAAPSARASDVAVIAPAHPAAGGAYLIVDIDAWGAKAAEIERDRADLLRALTASGVGFEDSQATGPVFTFRLKRLEDYAAAVRALHGFDINEVKAEVSLEPGGRVKVVVPTAWTDPGGPDDLDEAVDRVIDRAEARGLPTPDVEDLDGHRARLDFTGITDADLMSFLKRPQPKLTIQLIDEQAPLEAARAGDLPADAQVLPCDLPGEPFAVIKREVLMSGADVADAQSAVDDTGRPAVVVRFDQHGADLFAEVTRRYAGRRFAITLNGRVISAPRIGGVISDGVGQISGDFTADGAEGLAKVIRSSAPLTPMVVEDGPLPYREASGAKP
jgi:preprotein translocase subunit SecD